ncbi:hypothetical protein AAY473_031581 [Plecturocebus cupreus]
MLMWPQLYLPPCPVILEETRQSKLAVAINNPGVGTGAKQEKIKKMAVTLKQPLLVVATHLRIHPKTMLLPYNCLFMTPC